MRIKFNLLLLLLLYFFLETYPHSRVITLHIVRKLKTNGETEEEEKKEKRKLEIRFLIVVEQIAVSETWTASIINGNLQS